MLIFIKKAILVIVLWNVYSLAFAQKSTDAEFVFKTWFFLEKENSTIRYDTVFSAKDSSVFSLFQKEVELNFDTLETNRFSDDYIFLSVVPYRDNEPVSDSAIVYKNLKLIGDLVIPVNNCKGFTLCVNKVKGTSYRLQGFSGNDFLNLMHEVQEEHVRVFKATLSVRTFLKKYRVQGIDFNCLYKGLLYGKADSVKFPCLQRCKDIKIMLGH